MGRILSLLVVVAIMFAGYFYMFKASGPAISSPHSAPNAAGAQNDILAIAQAERAYQAENGSYARLDKLLSSGALSMQKPGREGYEYNVEPSSTNFRVVARCTGAASGCTSFFVDSTMSVQPLQ
ncbi:MAG: hypothetical protein WB869_17340 [Candidatus Acidiferrales bacterium]